MHTLDDKETLQHNPVPLVIHGKRERGTYYITKYQTINRLVVLKKALWL